MNFNIYLEKDLENKLNYFSLSLGKKKNTIIREAISHWIQHQEEKKWPSSVLNFQGLGGFSSFETERINLIEPKEDPFN